MLPERPCSCGGTFRSIGQNYLRMGDSPLLVGPTVYNIETLGVEVLVCDRCREMKFFLVEEPVYLEDPQASQKLTPVEQYKENFSLCPRKTLVKIVESPNYLPEARRAARELLAERFGED